MKFGREGTCVCKMNEMIEIEANYSCMRVTSRSPESRKSYRRELRRLRSRGA